MPGPRLIELFRTALEAGVAELHTTCPGIVVSYDAATQTATIQPAVRRVIEDEDGEQVEEDFPQLQNIPIEWPGAGGMYLHFPLQPGDTGVISYCERSISEWRETGQVSTPGYTRLHAIGSATFRPGLRDSKSPREDAPASGEAVLSVGEGLFRVGDSSAALVALAGLVSARLDKIQETFDAHVHPTPSGPSSVTGTLIGTLDSVACEKLKAQ